jgi:uncharacterized protein YuzE
MTIQYYEDTDTLYIILKEGDVAQKRGLDKNTVVEYDAKGNLVSMTVGHARKRTDVGRIYFRRAPTMKPMA